MAVYAAVPTVVGVVAILVVVLILVARRRSKRSLGEPDFQSLAFGADGTADLVVLVGGSVDAGENSNKEKLAQLEELLLANDKLISAVCNTTQSTEMDKVAKALTYVFYQKGKLVNWLDDWLGVIVFCILYLISSSCIELLFIYLFRSINESPQNSYHL